MLFNNQYFLNLYISLWIWNFSIEDQGITEDTELLTDVCYDVS